MKTIQYKVKTKNEFEVQVKNGAKVIDSAKKVTNGWYAVCKVWLTLEEAMNAIKESCEQRANAFGGECKVEFI